MLTGYRTRSPRVRRSMSGSLRPFIESGKVVYCTNAPRRHEYLEARWRAEDRWNSPET